MKVFEILEGDVVDFAAAKQRKMNKAGPKPPLPDLLNLEYEPPKASVDRLPLRSIDDISAQIRKVLTELDTTFKWVDDYTAIAHYNPADYVRAVNAFDQLFGERERTGRTAYMWHVDNVTVTFTLETRKIIIEIE